MSTKFSDLVVPREEKDERKWVFKIMGVREGRVELKLVYTKSVWTEDIADVLVHEGHAQYVGHKGEQAMHQELPKKGVDPLLPVLSSLGDCLEEMERPLPSHLEEEMENLKREAIFL